MAKKVDLKELKQADKFHTIIGNAIQWFTENKQKFYMVSAIITGIIVISGGWYLYRLHTENVAAQLYSSAYIEYQKASEKDVLDKEKAANAVKLYGELTNKYPGTSSSNLAIYDMGNIYFDLNEIDKSIDSYKKFIEKSSRNNILKSFAYYSLGYCYETKKDYKKALESFENSNNFGLGNQFKAINYRNIARVYEGMDNNKKALEYYQKALEQTNGDQLIEMLLKSKIARLS